MRTLTRSIFIAATLAAGGAMLAVAQGVPGPDAPAAEPAGPSANERLAPAQARGERAGDVRHSRRSRAQRSGLVGVFGPGNLRTLFAELDADGSETVSQDEIDAFLASEVADADTDGDGSLSLTEFEPIYIARIRERIVDRFQDLDADGSGAITADEIDTRFGDTVSRLDRDGDNALTLEDRASRRVRD
ncbi:EF-hand domain-containing protein [Aestuariibius sp. 2305UL40-4]|uniref:EF-hand domain-containing protein n=1 Tax=Aestuariibius violaceus TaxID=3234132 RepID=UPI00345E0A78